MSLSDMYGGNIDLETKYGVPTTKRTTDPSKTPLIRSGYTLKDWQINELPRDIRVEKELYQNYINLLIDAHKYINNNQYKTAYEAYSNDEIDDYKMQVLSQDEKYALLATPIYTKQYYDSGAKNWYSGLINEDDAYNEYWKYYPIEGDQSYAIIKIRTGTFDSYFDELHTDVDDTNIYFFKNGNIYCTGSEFLHNVPIDYLSKVLDECIEELNTGIYDSFIPTMVARIFYKSNYFAKDPKENRQYILKREVGNHIKRYNWRTDSYV